MSTRFWNSYFLVTLIMSLIFPEINCSAVPISVNMSSATTPPPLSFNGTFQLNFYPESINELIRDCNTTVYFNGTFEEVGDKNVGEIKNGSKSTDFYARIVSGNAEIVQFVKPVDMVVKTPSREDISNLRFTSELKIPIHINGVNNFTIQAMHIGYVTVFVTIFGTGSLVMARSSQMNQPLGQGELKVAVVSRQKPADFVFDCSAAAVAILISFGIGCVTDTENLKRQLKYPVSLVLGFCCQFLLMPVLAFGLAMILPLQKNVQFGLLCVACVPGGGLGHVAVIISKADLPLSLTMNLISTVTMLGTAPLWIFVLGQYFQQTEGSKIIPIYNFEIWLASTFFSYTAGLVINRFKPNVAEGLLNWFIKPFLLLATILYITVGVYINMYVFEKVDKMTVLAAMLLPLCGVLVGTVLSIIFRQKSNFCKTIALETSSLNCLIVLAALRFSLNQPDADLASVIPIWVMFTIPALYVILAILGKFKGKIDMYLESRKKNQTRHYSIASGIVNQANMAALSAPLFVTETITDDDQQSGISEKVTVL
ncbi:sodium/bile acid cotransporter 5-like [Ruditapes philippinarum]|uniref:sodium/bile acid cotransporter 5-like n=1 Tax=Ruditapes philippinarum TaxID=129788 RepID=UPI00295B8276|nr:sodium/bile acid cotransporter 5-like [Ruditapes philippinarum]XP_060576299.1 sodium/bile acid cotransporter 5-like [Ruditapes philippinarum]